MCFCVALAEMKSDDDCSSKIAIMLMRVMINLLEKNEEDIL